MSLIIKDKAKKIKLYTRNIFCLLIFCSTINIAIAQPSTLVKENVVIVADPLQTAAVQFAIGKLTNALKQQGFTVKVDIADTDDESAIMFYVWLQGSKYKLPQGLSKIKMPTTAEEMFIKKIVTNQSKKQGLLIAGGDSVGLMYALLEVASQVRNKEAAASLLASVEEASETAFAKVRSLSTYIHADQVRTRIFHDAQYWDELFEQVAESRFNYYNIIFKNAAPIYTMFFNIPGWTTAQVGGLQCDEAEQQRNLAALQRIAKQAHDHGVKLIVGIWNHVHKPEDAERVSPYSEAAIEKFVSLVAIDGLQLRMHWESGLPREINTLAAFWGRVFDGIKKSGRDIIIYPRAKGLPDTVINLAVQKGLKVAVETKYSAEQFGMPFHPAHIQPENQTDRRHGYADLLTHPKRYDVLYRLWNAGSQKLLVWADADYAKQFVKTCQLYNEEAMYEVMDIDAIESTGDAMQHLNEKYIYTNYNFQRYWAQNLVFGRMGYNPNTASSVFLRYFNEHYGKDIAAEVMTTLQLSSKIIPRIISAAMPDFQEQRGIPEWGSGSGLNGKGFLKNYAKVRPLDVQTFISFKEAADLLINKKTSGRVWPQQNATYFDETSKAIYNRISSIEKKLTKPPSKELVTTLGDMRILAAIAAFHAQRIKAALFYNIYQLQKNNKAALDSAIYYDTKALSIYAKVVEASADYYKENMKMSVSDTRNWKEEYVMLLSALDTLKASPVSQTNTIVSSLEYRLNGDDIPPKISHKPVINSGLDNSITITADISDAAGIKWARVLYRGLTQFQDYKIAEMQKQGNSYTVTIPNSKVQEVTEYHPITGVKWDFMYIIETVDNNNNGNTWPYFEKEEPYHIVNLPHKTIKETGGQVSPSAISDQTYNEEGQETALQITFPRNGDVYPYGTEIILQVKNKTGYSSETIFFTVNGAKMKVEKRADGSYVIRGLKMGLQKIEAFLSSTRESFQTKPIEITITE